MASSSRGIQMGSAWFQRKINLRPQHRGVHLVTEEILRQVPELGNFTVGLFHLQSECDLLHRIESALVAIFWQNLISVLHTSASLALNESWDPDVRDDMESMLNKLVPEVINSIHLGIFKQLVLELDFMFPFQGLPYKHSCEGPDDMVSIHQIIPNFHIPR